MLERNKMTTQKGKQAVNLNLQSSLLQRSGLSSFRKGAQQCVGDRVIRKLGVGDLLEPEASAAGSLRRR